MWKLFNLKAPEIGFDTTFGKKGHSCAAAVQPEQSRCDGHIS